MGSVTPVQDGEGQEGAIIQPSASDTQQEKSPTCSTT